MIPSNALYESDQNHAALAGIVAIVREHRQECTEPDCVGAQVLAAIMLASPIKSLTLLQLALVDLSKQPPPPNTLDEATEETRPIVP